MREQHRFWRDCAYAQSRLNLCCSHVQYNGPFSNGELIMIKLRWKRITCQRLYWYIGIPNAKSSVETDQGLRRSLQQNIWILINILATSLGLGRLTRAKILLFAYVTSYPVHAIKHNTLYVLINAMAHLFFLYITALRVPFHSLNNHYNWVLSKELRDIISSKSRLRMRSLTMTFTFRQNPFYNIMRLCSRTEK